MVQDCRGSLLKSSPKSDSNSLVLDTSAQTGRAVVCCWFLQMHCAKYVETYFFLPKNVFATCEISTLHSACFVGLPLSWYMVQNQLVVIFAFNFFLLRLSPRRRSPWCAFFFSLVSLYGSSFALVGQVFFEMATEAPVRKCTCVADVVDVLCS